MSETTATPEQLAALREAWIDLPDGGVVPHGVGTWLQPFINAVTAIVDPSGTLRNDPEVKRRGEVSRLRALYEYARNQVKLAMDGGLSAATQEWRGKAWEAARDLHEKYGIDVATFEIEALPPAEGK